MKFDRATLLLLLSAFGLALLFHVLRLPGAFLFGPLAASAIFAVRGWCAIRLPNPVYIAGQAVIGTALGAGFSPQTLGVIPQHAGIFTFAVVFILATSLFNGWLLNRFTPLDAGTAFLGTMPGGASVMASMSDSLHADTRLVTAIQYVRLLVILASLACVAPILKTYAPHTGAAGPGFVIYQHGAGAVETWRDAYAGGDWLAGGNADEDSGPGRFWCRRCSTFCSALPVFTWADCLGSRWRWHTRSWACKSADGFSRRRSRSFAG